MGEPTKSIAAAAPPAGGFHHLLDRVGCGVVDGCDGSHLAGLCALLRVDVGDDDLAGYRGRRDVHGTAADSAGADDDQMVVATQMSARLLQRREGGDAGASVGRGEVLRHSLMRQLKRPHGTITCVP